MLREELAQHTLALKEVHELALPYPSCFPRHTGVNRLRENLGRGRFKPVRGRKGDRIGHLEIRRPCHVFTPLDIELETLHFLSTQGSSHADE